MIGSFTRTASKWLAFGSFFVLLSACSTLFQSIDPGEAEQAYDDEQYEEALSITERMLEEEPGNADLLLIRARSLDKMAASRSYPSERSDYYSEMIRTLETLEQQADSRHLESRDELIAESWQREQSAGTDILQEVPEPDSDVYNHMKDHFNNALLLNPVGSETYASLASIYYGQGELQRALELIEQAEDNLDRLPFELRETQAYLLLETGEIELAKSIYRDLLDEQPGHFDVMHGLVNAYILTDDHESSVRHLRDLVEMEPDNFLYHQTLATELFFYINSSIQSLEDQDLPDEERMDVWQFIMDQLIEAENHYQAVLELHPNPDEILYSTAAFYKNMARNLIQAAAEGDDAIAEDLLGMATDLLSRSLPVWEDVADLNPENPDIWMSMYQIYSHLGMDNEAESARSRANRN